MLDAVLFEPGAFEEQTTASLGANGARRVNDNGVRAAGEVRVSAKQKGWKSRMTSQPLSLD